MTDNIKPAYTLWTIPRSAWSELPTITFTEQEKAELVEYAKTLDDDRLKDRIKPFQTKIHPSTWYKVLP